MAVYVHHTTSRPFLRLMMRSLVPNGRRGCAPDSPPSSSASPLAVSLRGRTRMCGRSPPRSRFPPSYRQARARPPAAKPLAARRVPARARFMMAEWFARGLLGEVRALHRLGRGEIARVSRRLPGGDGDPVRPHRTAVFCRHKVRLTHTEATVRAATQVVGCTLCGNTPATRI